MSVVEKRPQDSTILIVDDNPANARVIVNYLADYGFQVMVARTGEAGLELARQDQPDLILLDVIESPHNSPRLRRPKEGLRAPQAVSSGLRWPCRC
jgi:CheY-like chemotaxis protein